MFIRIKELVEGVRARFPKDTFFFNFEASCEERRLKREFYQRYEEALVTLNEPDWRLLKEKAIRHFKNHREGQLKTGLFAQLNESFAYRYLNNQGYGNVCFVPEGKARMPDISFEIGGVTGHCEVKSIGISDEEIKRRGSQDCIDGLVYRRLSPAFFGKLKLTVASAQMQAGSGGAMSVVYVVIDFDDGVLDYLEEYRRQLQEFVQAYPPGRVILQLGQTLETIVSPEN